MVCQAPTLRCRSAVPRYSIHTPVVAAGVSCLPAVRRARTACAPQSAALPVGCTQNSTLPVAGLPAAVFTEVLTVTGVPGVTEVEDSVRVVVVAMGLAVATVIVCQAPTLRCRSAVPRYSIHTPVVTAGVSC